MAGGEWGGVRRGRLVFASAAPGLWVVSLCSLGTLVTKRAMEFEGRTLDEGSDVRACVQSSHRGLGKQDASRNWDMGTRRVSGNRAR